MHINALSNISLNSNFTFLWTLHSKSNKKSRIRILPEVISLPCKT